MSHAQPCRLPDTVPEKKAPMLQPVPSRAPTPSSSPPRIAARSEAQGNRKARAEFPGEDRGEHRSQNDPEIGHGGGIGKYRVRQRRFLALPVGPGFWCEPGERRDLAAPEREGRGDPPRPAIYQQHGDVDQRQRNRAGNQRPRPGEPVALDPENWLDTAMARLLCLADREQEKCENAEHDTEACRRAEPIDQRDRRQARPAEPVIRVGGCQCRAGDEKRQRHHHAQRAAAHREQRARTAAAAELHPDAEHESAKDQRPADREHKSADRVPEGLPLGDEWKEDKTREREHHELRPDAGAAPLEHEPPPRRSETEAGVIERDAGPEADGGEQQQNNAAVP